MPEPAQVRDASAPHKTVLADIHTSLAAIDDYCCAKCSITLLLLYILQLTELMQCRCQRNSVELVLWFDIGTKTYCLRAGIATVATVLQRPTHQYCLRHNITVLHHP